jgi:hypothetical protein
MAKHLVMDTSGHSTIEFDAKNTVSLAEAEKRFKELTGAGFTAAVREGEGKSRLIRSFDPTVEETLFFPRIGGG